jgi:CrcB protein
VKLIWYVALGGAAGSVLRFVLGGLIQRGVPMGYPWGTIVINISGSLLLGLLMSYMLASPGASAEARALLATGFCGGYTTFSTFSYEFIALVQGGDWRGAGVYLGVTLLGSLVAAWLGLAAGHRLLLLQQRL